MAHLNPYLNFNGQCREAMTFYNEILGGELKMMEKSQTPMAEKSLPEKMDSIMHSQIEKEGKILLMASDMLHGEEKEGNTVNIMLNCESEKEINHLYNQFSQGGEILDELKLQFWGDIFGMVKDIYGKTWMFNYIKNQGSK